MSRQGKKPDRLPDDEQLSFDWSRATRQKWLDHLDIPEFEYEGRKVRTHRLTMFLQRIETFTRDGGDWRLSEERIRISCGKPSLRTVRRLIAICEARGLLTVTREPGKASWYAINWTEVKQILLDNPKTETVVLMPTKAQQATPVNLTATPDNLSQTPVNLSQTPVNLSATSDTNTTLRVRADFNHRFNHEVKPEIKPCSSSVVETSNFETLPQPANGGWTRPLTLNDFRDRDSIQRLWQHALKFKFVTPDMRFKFWTLAKYVQRMTIANKIETPGAYFTAQLIKRNWLGDSEDARAARSALSLVDKSKGYSED